MNPLKLTPAFKDYLWGGNKLKTKYNKKTPLIPLAESWELSCHKDGHSIITGGKYDGRTLESVIAENPKILGTYNNGDELPILIKFIDAAESLSVQVHPDDELAKKWEGQNGKTEMWYVVEADKDAHITYGVKNKIAKDQLKQAITEKKVESLLNSVPSAKGDVFFVDAGTIHAIGKGNLIAEIQQNSNVTYRLYDYGRVGKDGKERELHIEKGVECSSCKPITPRKTPICSDGTRLLGSCEFFAVKELKLNGEKVFFSDDTTYTALIVTEGSVKVSCKDYSGLLSAGETMFIPANSGEYILSGKATVLSVSSPPRYFIGIDLGGTNIVAAVVDEYGTIYGKAKCKTNTPRDYKAIFDDMAECAKTAAIESGISFDCIEAVGIGCPGAIDKETGTVEFSNNLDFYDVPIVEYMGNALNKKIYVDNDANAAAWGEFLAGCGKNTNSMVMITLGTGVGSGIIENGRLLCGAYGKGAEIGHMVINVGGEKCTCGRRGCFEAYASATALINQTKKAMKENPGCEMWKICDGKLSNANGQTAFKGKDAVSKMVVKTYLNHLAQGVVNIVNIFQPEIVCIGGGISHEGKRLLSPIAKEIKNKSFARFGKEQSTVGLATLGNDAGIIGAALLWKNEEQSDCAARRRRRS